MRARSSCSASRASSISIGLNGYYSLLAMMMNVARTPPDAADAKPLEPFPN